MKTDTIFGYSLDEIKERQQGNYINKKVDTEKQGDYGQDPLGNGMHRMVPSGDIVTTEEMMKRLDM